MLVSSATPQRVRRLLISLIGLLSPCFLGAGELPDAREILKLCIASQSMFERVSMRLTVDVSLDYPDDRPKQQRCEFLLQRDGDWIDIEETYKYIDSGSENSYENRIVKNAQFFVESRWRLAENSQKKAMVAKVTRDTLGRQALNVSVRGGPLCGVFNNMTSGVHIAALLREAVNAKLAREEQLNGIHCYVITGHTRYGDVTLWIAPDKGYNLLKGILDCQGNDLWDNDKPLSEQPPWSPSGRADDLRRITRCLYELDSVRLETIQGRQVPVEGEFKSTIFRGGARPVVDRMRYKRSDVTFDPDFKKSEAFKVDLPDGLLVNFLDDGDSGVVYKWEGGDVRVNYVPFTGEKEGFGHSSKMVRWLVITNAAVVALLLLVWFRNRIKPKSEP